MIFIIFFFNIFYSYALFVFDHFLHTVLASYYSTHINTPLQGLCIFLAEYGDFDWTSYVITLQGIVPFKQSPALQQQQQQQEDVPWMRSPKPHHLINEEMINKYKHVLSNHSHNMQCSRVNSAATPNASAGSSTNINTSFTNAEPSTTPRISSSGTILASDMEDQQSTILNSVTSQLSSLSTSNHTHTGNVQLKENSIALFERRPLNVVNPFTLTNMISEKLNSRRAKRVIKVFQMGARNLCVTIKSFTGPPGLTTGTSPNISQTTALQSFFRNIYNRFGNGWRPDVLNKSLSVDAYRQQRNGDLTIWNIRTKSVMR